MDRIKVSIGHSIDIDTALEKALKNIKRPTAVITFFSSRFDPNEIYKKIREKVGDKVDILGASTAGEISNVMSDCQANTVSIAVIESPYVNIGVGVGKDMSKNVEAATYTTKDSFVGIVIEGTVGTGITSTVNFCIEVNSIAIYDSQS